MKAVTIDSFLAYTLGIVVFFVGVHLNRRCDLLRAYNIPEPVTGGLVAASVTFAIYLALDLEISFDLETRDRLLVYFFTAIGLNARISSTSTGNAGNPGCDSPVL